MDADGQYRGRDGQIHQSSGFTNYSVFSLWDTYRTLHPLLNLLEPERSKDFLNSFFSKNPKNFSISSSVMDRRAGIEC